MTPFTHRLAQFLSEALTVGTEAEEQPFEIHWIRSEGSNLVVAVMDDDGNLAHFRYSLTDIVQ